MLRHGRCTVWLATALLVACGTTGTTANPGTPTGDGPGFTASSRSATTSAVADTTTTTVPGGTPATASETTRARGAVNAEVTIQLTAFTPRELTVPVGTTVIWSNLDTIGHTTTSDDGVWESGTLNPGDSFAVDFEQPGTFAYFCGIHPGTMRATLTVDATHGDAESAGP